MNLLEFLFLLAIAGVCGAVGRALAGYERGGCLVAVALGFLGALLGGWIARSLHLPAIFAVHVGENAYFPVVWSIFGAALFVALMGLFARPRRKDR